MVSGWDMEKFYYTIFHIIIYCWILVYESTIYFICLSVCMFAHSLVRGRSVCFHQFQCLSLYYYLWLLNSRLYSCSHFFFSFKLNSGLSEFAILIARASNFNFCSIKSNRFYYFIVAFCCCYWSVQQFKKIKPKKKTKGKNRNQTNETRFICLELVKMFYGVVKSNHIFE